MVEHGGLQADMVLEVELRILHLVLQATRSGLGVTLRDLSKGYFKH